jgi:hypothetical protein
MRLSSVAVAVAALFVAFAPGQASSLTIDSQIRAVEYDFALSFYDPVDEHRTGTGASDSVQATDLGPFVAAVSGTVEAFPGAPGTPAIVGDAGQDSSFSTSLIRAEGSASMTLLNEGFDENHAAVYQGSPFAQTLFAVTFTVDAPTEVRVSGFLDGAIADFFGPPGFVFSLGDVFDEELVLPVGSYDLFIEAIVVGEGDEDDPVPNTTSPATGAATFAFDLQVIPEPGTAALLLTGIAGLALSRQRSLR